MPASNTTRTKQHERKIVVLDVDFWAAASLEGWVQFIENAKLLRRSQTESDRVPSAGVTAISESRDVLLTISCHEMKAPPNLEPNQRQMHWEIKFQQVPTTSPPPAWVLKASEEAGGMGDVLRRFTDAWPVVGELSLQVSAMFETSATSKMAPAVKRAAAQDVDFKHGGRKLRALSSMWSLRSGNRQQGIITAGKVGKPAHLLLGWSGTIELGMTHAFRQELEEKTWKMISPLLSSGRRRSRS